MYFMSTACGRPQGGPAHVDRGKGGQKSDFFVDVINGWPLCSITVQHEFIFRDAVDLSHSHCKIRNGCIKSLMPAYETKGHNRS